MALTGLDAWHRVVETKDLDLLSSMIADDAAFHSPVVFKPQQGKALTLKYLSAATKVLANDAFHYVGQWTSPGSAVLEFITEIEGVAIDGVDMITWNADGKIVDFKVMIRPLKAIEKVLQKMGEELAKSEG